MLAADLDRTRLLVKPLAERVNDLQLSRWLALEDATPEFDSPDLETVAARLKRAREKGREIKRLPNGNAVLSYDEPSEEGDEPVHIWYWEIVNPLPPRHARIALFTYTVDEDAADDPDTAECVALLHRELEACEFAQEMGE